MIDFICTGASMYPKPHAPIQGLATRRRLVTFARSLLRRRRAAALSGVAMCAGGAFVAMRGLPEALAPVPLRGGAWLLPGALGGLALLLRRSFAVGAS